jgi:hypothetical protein
MAKIVQAVSKYGPKLKLNPTAQLKKVADWMAMRTGLNTSEALMLLQELHEALLYFNAEGTPVKLPGIGTFTPSIDRNGQFKINLRPDAALKKGLNTPDAYTGEITNQKHIGLTDEEYKAIWDQDHPTDQLDIPTP